MNGSPHIADDPELVQRSLAGETAAFAQLVEKHQRLVFGVALSSAGDAAVAEEVAQEAFVEAWRDLRRLRDPGRVGSWIAGIARNLARTWSRTSSRRRRQVEAIASEVELSAQSTTPLEDALDRESRTLVRQALDEIPASYREALVLFYVHGRSVSEVAVGLGITEDLVKQRLLRGRRALRDSLEHGIEGALDKARPSKAFTSIVMVAVSSAIANKATAATTAGTAGKLISIMSANKIALGVASLVVATGAAWYGLSQGAAAPSAPSTAVPHVASAPSPLSSSPAKDQKPTGVRKFANAAERERLLHTIRQAQQRRRMRAAAPAQAAAGAASPVSGADLDKDYIATSVRELLPFIQECYETMLVTKPNIQGTVVVNFTIEGEPETGGLVTESSIEDRSDIKDAEFHECVRETMFALEIDPPSNGGKIKVVYPFSFRFTDEP